MSKILVVAALCLSSALAAQATTFTSPPGYLTKSGGIYASNWGSFMDARQQMIDQSMPKSKAVLTKIEYRTMTYYWYINRYGMGRTWSKAALTLAHCSAKITNTFSTNYKGSGTLVYSAKTSLPSHTSGKPTQVWGNAGSFTLDKTFSYDGSGSLLMDWSFTGGTLVNGSTFYFSPYYVDGPLYNLTVNLSPGHNSDFGKYVPKKPRTSPTCADSGHGTREDAYVVLYAQIFGDNWPWAPWAGRFRVHTAASYYTANNAKVIATLTVGGSDKGVKIPGAKCYPLHVNMGFPLVISTKTASSYSGIASRHVPMTYHPYSDSWAGTKIFFQAAWEDSKTKQLGLTIANRFVLPKKPVYPAFGVVVYQYFVNNKPGGPPLMSSSIDSNPIERFTTR